jgi:hypothetical protein
MQYIIKNTEMSKDFSDVCEESSGSLPQRMFAQITGSYKICTTRIQTQQR